MHNKNSKIKRASLNHTYRLVWSDAKQMYIAVAEIAPGKGKRKGGIVGAIAALMMGFGGIAHALDPGTLPEGANIVHGQAQIQQHNNVMTIHQTSDKLITNWNSFNIGKDATVNFQQPNSNSAALNRVMDNNPSQIHGRLNANGNVYLVNPSGILFGKTAQVDVGGLIASTLEISDQDFLDNKLDFKNLGFSEGDIKNLGHIRANGGVVALIANRVSNQGTIEANNGNVALAAGDHVTLDFNGDGLMTVTVEQGVLDALAENGGLIQADGGFVIMTTQARQDIYRNLVNNDGLIQAQTLSSKSGRIMLMGGMTQGQVTASGKLDASAPNGGDGGFIETSAAKVDIQPGLVVTTKAETGKTGEWLIDPTDIEIVAGTGGDFDSNASSSTQIGADTLVANLANNNITVQTPSADTGAQLGDITVSADIVWNANTTLTLDAINHIYVKAKIENQNTTGGGVYFNAANNHFAVGFDNNGKVVIHNAEQLQWMNTALSGKYQLGSDIVLTAPAEGESNWTPIGDSSSLFRGIFDGKNHTIDGLTMNSTGNYQGFFGINFTHSVIKNLGLTNVDINSTGWYIGGLIGENRGTLSHVYVTGKVTGETSDFIGGVVGVNGGGNIDNAFSSATVKGRDSVGGLIGRNLINVMGVTSSLTISNTFFTGSVEGRTNVGGLIGENSMSANVMMMGNANANLSIEDSYATGKVKGQDDVGGLIGKNSISASGGTAKSTLTITNTYSTASVEGATNTGGLIGSNTVTRTNNGQATITTTDSFWDTQTSGLAGADDGVGNQNATTSGVQGKTTSEMQSVITAVYDKWDFDTVWEMDGDYPVFQVQTVIEPCDVTSGLPSCGRVINGAGTIGDIDGNNLTINQTASKLIIDWKQFDIAAGNTVHFEQKENGVAQTSWVALNRVTENNPSQILGKLTADGRVYLVNPSGILFGANAQVDVAGLVASNAQINQADFNNGTLTFADPTGGYISVQGTTENWSLGEGGLTLVAHSDASNRFVVDEAAPDDTSSGISATALLNRLEDSQVVLRVLNSNGSFENSAMDINQDIVWSANNALRLHSDHRINVNALIANNSDDGGVYIQSVNNNNSLLFGENGIVEVYNLHQLQRINQTLKGKFRLGQDIDATETANWNNNQGWMPIGDNGDRFQGTFDGQGYTLSNLFINRPDTYNVGLFGVVSNSGAEIKNLGLVNVDITGLEGVGAITGRNLASSQIQNVFSTGVVKGTWTLGGLVGLNEGTISKAYSNARVDGVENTIGGLVGSNSDTGVISNVYSSGAVSGGGFIGGLLGTNAGVISSAYTTASVSSPDPKYVGGLVGISNGTINHSFWDIGATGLTTSAGGEGKTASEMRTSTTFTNAGWSTEVWSFTEAGQGAAVEGYEFGGGLPYLTALTRKEDQDNPITLFAGGWGDADDKGAYTITNWNQLQNINLVVGEGFDFALSNDLTTSTDGYAEQVKNGDTLANNGAGWNPIGEFSNRFSGSFDGQGNTLSNLTINRSSENNIGLFGFVENATISNIGLDGGSINGNGQTGALIGNAQNNTQVIQTYSTLNVEGAGFTGGLVGFLANSTIVNSYATGDVTASGNSIGGLVGYLEDSTITNSYAAGDVVAGHGNFWVMPSYAGGLVGYSFTDYKDIELTNVYATGKVTGSGSFIGGLIGVIDGSSVRAESATALVTNAYASGAVSGATVDSSDPDTLGGLIGGVLDGNKFALDVTKSFWDTQTSGQTTSAGGEGKTIAQMKDALTFTGWDTDIWSFPAAGRGAEIEGYEWGEGGLPYLTHVTRVEDLEGGGAPIILFAGGWGGLTDGDADGSAYTITNWNQLQNINLVLDKGFDFLLSNNLTTETTGYAEQVKNGDTLANNGTGWMPIGNLSTRFTGVFDGAHHTIDGLRIHSTTASIFQGFFGATASVSEIKNLGLTNVDIETPSLHVGGLVGTNLSALSDVYVTGSVTGDRLVGGLVGSNTATITNAYAAGSVTATGNVAGGLIGQNSGFYGSTSISNTYFAGDVKGQNNVGGLIGENSSSPMMGEVTLNITNAYATGSVEGSSRVGGLIGANTAEAFISNSKATINITHTYATASVEANDVDYPGGLVGANTVTQQSGGEATITITDSFWDRDTSDVSGADEGVGNQDAATSGVRGKTTAEMKGASTFTGWDTNIWSFPAAGRGAEIEGYEWGEGGLPYLTHVTRVEDRDGGGAPIILFAGGWGGLTDGDADGSAYTIVNWNQLQNINLVVGEGFDFALSNDLTTETDGYAEQVKNGDTLANNGTGWMPLGNDANRFTGVFDGANHLIDGLIIDRSAGRQGLFGVIENVSTVKNLGLTNVDISSTSSRVGGLAGDNRGSVSNVYVTGDITGGFTTGGLIGQNRGTLNDVHVIGNVKAGGSVGGLVGDNRGSIETAYVVGSVKGDDSNVGGLIGYNNIQNVDQVTINKTYFSGSVEGQFYVGGLIGQNYVTRTLSISNAYAIGSVKGNSSVGGLIGSNYVEADGSDATLTISSTYSASSVTGSSGVGGLVGRNTIDQNDGEAAIHINHSFWDTSSTGQTTSAGGGTGKKTPEMKDASTFTTELGSDSWDTNIWSFPAAGRGAEIEGYEYGDGGLPYLTNITRVQDQGNPVILFEGGWGDADDKGAYTITNWNQLQNINLVLDKNFDFLLSNNLNSETDGYAEQASVTANEGTGWMPIGNDANRFTGVFDGGHHTIDGLIINRSSHNQGLFGATATFDPLMQIWGSEIKNLGLTNVDINVAGHRVGALVGENRSTVSNVYVTGSVKGGDFVGGLIGQNTLDFERNGADALSISNGYSTASVTGNDHVGGLIGANSVRARSKGGSATINITNTNAAASVTGAVTAGGLVGNNLIFGDSGTETINITGSFWNTQTAGADVTRGVASGDADPAGVVGKTTTELQTLSTFTDAGWDISNVGGEQSVWRIYEGYTAPMLRSFLTPLTLEAAGSLSKTYDATTDIDASELALSWKQDGQVVTPDGALLRLAKGSPAFVLASKNAGNQTLLSQHYSTQTGFDIIADLSVNVEVNKANLAVMGLGAEDRVYDGTTDAPIIGQAMVKALGKDSVTLAGDVKGTFVDKNVGENKAVTLSGLTLTGEDAGNYTLVLPSNFVASISKADLTISGLSVADRVYDGSRIATIVIDGVQYAGLVGKDDVKISATGEFADKNVGENKEVTISSTYSGADVGNYKITNQTTTTANITAKELVIKGLTAKNRTYDGSRVATIVIDGVEYAGLVENDDVSISATGEFDNKNVGEDKEVTITSTYTGADLNNYSIVDQTTTTATITAKELIISGLTAEGKVYDGNRIATIVIDGVQYAGLVGKDEIKITATGEFDNKNIGENKTVSITSEYSGADVGNYKIVDQTETSANITAKELVIKGLMAENRTYDGSRVATIVIDGVEYAGLVKDDDVSISATGAFDDKNVGENKEVTITSTYSGTDVGNYKIVDQTETSANITAKELVIKGLTAENRTYDGSRVATIVINGVEYAGLVENDDVSISATGEFDDKNVGADKEVTITSTYSGADLGNYSIVDQTTTTATISAKELIISGLTAEGKVYDGNRIATIVIDGVQYAGLVENDDVSISATGEFDNKNVGENKTVSITSEYSGADVGNYKITNQATTTASITAKDLIISGLTAEGKVYDGNRIATIVIDGVKYAGLVENDEVNISATGEFDNKNVGVDKEVTITSTYSGADVGNYKITNQTTTTANITAKELVIKGLTAENRTYDGSRVATIVVDGVEYAGLVKDDDVSISATGAFDDKNVGENKEVTITSTYSGTDVGNYKIVDQTETSANITAKELVIKGLTAENRTYDGSRVATIVVDGVEYAGLVKDDEVNISASGEFDDKNVGENKTVAITSTYSGADVGNYKITDQTTTTANITAKELVIKGLTAENRTYDGSRVATIVINGVEYAGLVKDDDVSISATGEFDDKNVGVDKEVTITSTYSGADVGNYKIVDQTETSANITAKELVIKGLMAENRTYDGSRVATIVIGGVEYAGLVKDDDVSISATGEFSDKNVGVDKVVTIASTYTGADLGNYSIVDQTTTTATITAKELIISGLTAEGKVYDGNRIATIVIDGVQYAGLVGKDDVKISAMGEFADKNVGENKTVSITSEFSGADVGNYKITNQATTTASITAKDLIISGLTAEGKVYDGSKVATIVINGVEYAGLVENDEVNISATGEFDDKNVGENKTVTITSDYSGADVGNYSIQNQATTMASITPKGLTISGMSAEDKFYDGNTRATLLGGELVGVVAGERLSFTGQSGQFASIAVGTHDVSVSGLSLVALENADINNYTVSIPENIRATINPQAGTDTGAQQRDTVVNVPEAQTPVLTSAPSLVADTRAADVVADAIPAPVAAAPAEPVAAEPVAAEPVAAEPVAAEPVAAEPVAAEPVAAEPVEVETVEVETVEAETVETETVETETVEAETAEAETTEAETTEAETAAAEPAVVEQPQVRSSSVTINGETVALSFSQTAEVATLEVGDASMATDEVIQPGLAIYESSGGTTRLDSVVDISDRGNSVSATAGSADTAQASIETSSPVVEQTSISLTNEEGVEESMDVSMLEDGTLVIDLPANASVSDSRQATLMGVAAAKRAGVSVDRLKAVVINRR